MFGSPRRSTRRVATADGSEFGRWRASDGGSDLPRDLAGAEDAEAEGLVQTSHEASSMLGTAFRQGGGL